MNVIEKTLLMKRIHLSIVTSHTECLAVGGQCPSNHAGYVPVWGLGLIIAYLTTYMTGFECSQLLHSNGSPKIMFVPPTVGRSNGRHKKGLSAMTHLPKLNSARDVAI